MHPQQSPTPPKSSREQAVVDRWGVARCDDVKLDRVSAELSRLMAEGAGVDETDGPVEGLCRRRHSEQEARLEEAIALASRVEAVHRQDDAWPHGLVDQLEDILDCMVAHQQREQAVVFPMLMAGVDALPDQTVSAMIAAHEDLLGHWSRLDQRTGGFKAPAHACAAWRLLYVLCCKLYHDGRAQMELENRMLLAGREGRLRNHT